MPRSRTTNLGLLARLAGGSALVVAAGCGAPTETPEASGAASQPLPADGQVCVSLQRGTNGAVADATLWQNAPGWNDSTGASLWTGTSSAGPRRAVLRFDLAPIPATATVLSATLRLSQTYKNGSSTLDVHRITAPWTEPAVTWSSLGDDFDPAISGSLTAGSGVGTRTLDITALVGAWVSGAAPNHGLLMQEAPVLNTTFRSSETTTVTSRPALDVCYVTCSDGTQNGDETGVDCGGTSCAPCATSCMDDVDLPVSATPPPTLSATGLYSDIASGTIASYVRDYQPAYALWSDGETKRRFAYFPECTTIDTSDVDHWSFPVGSRLWKEFAVGGVPVETRLALRFGPGVDDWLFASYQWNAEGTEAYHVSDAVPNANGTTHDIPRPNDCWTCHGNLSERVLGMSALQLSHDLPGETMASLSAAGLLSVPLPGGVHAPGDAVASAALGYLHANCGNCHNSTGMATLRMRLLAANTTVESTDTVTTAVGVAPIFSAPGITSRIEPGDADASAIVYRMDAAQRGTMAQMPPLASELADADGLDAVRAWIDSLPPVGGTGGTGGAGTGGAGGAGGSGGAGGGTGSSSSSSSSSSASSSGGGACVGLPSLELTPIVSGLTQPVFAGSPPGDASRIFVVEKAGTVRLIKNGVLQPTPFLDIRGGTTCPPSSPASAHPLVCMPSPYAEGGLLGLAFHPDYATNGRFWLHYTAAPSGRVTVAEFLRSAADPDLADTAPQNLPVTKLVDAAHGGWNHVGGMLAFGPDGYLYASIGDSAVSPVSSSPAMNLSSVLGKILRVDVDTGLGPTGNMTGTGVHPLLWDYGLRNPWRFSFDRADGTLYIGDVGQNAWEEIDVEPPASGQRNYGWPTMEGNHCTASGCTQVGALPVVEHSHASGQGGAITGGYVYRGSAIPCLQGYYVYADSGTRRTWAFRWDGAAVQGHTEITADLAAPSGAMPVSFGEDANGELLVVMISGEIFRVDPE